MKATNKDHVDKVLKIINNRHGKLHTKIIGRGNSVLKLECQQGHMWLATYNNITNGTWCPQCSKNKKITIQDCRHIANMKGGECLSEKYVNIQTHLTWKCAKGHIWDAIIGNIKNKGFWCPDCAGNRRLNIEWFKRLAKSKGGECTSLEYKNQKTKLDFVCKEGHVWTAAADSVRNQNTWCPHCAGTTKYELSDCIDLATKRGGTCLSTIYKSANDKLLWKCKYNHEWLASLTTIRIGHWCNVCGESDRAAASNHSKKIEHWKTGEVLVAVASYEIAVIDFLNKNKINFEWQTKVFVTPFKTKKGKLSTYRPDLYLVDDNKWVEIKGYMRGDALDKWTWFQSEYPNSELWNETKLKELGIYDKNNKKLLPL